MASAPFSALGSGSLYNALDRIDGALGGGGATCPAAPAAGLWGAAPPLLSAQQASPQAASAAQQQQPLPTLQGLNATLADVAAGVPILGGSEHAQLDLTLRSGEFGVLAQNTFAISTACGVVCSALPLGVGLFKVGGGAAVGEWVGGVPPARGGGRCTGCQGWGRAGWGLCRGCSASRQAGSCQAAARRAARPPLPPPPPLPAGHPVGRV